MARTKLTDLSDELTAEELDAVTGGYSLSYYSGTTSSTTTLGVAYTYSCMSAVCSV